MAEYHATIEWRRDGAKFTDSRYSRAHTWRFDGELAVPASASPLHVALPMSVEAAVDPEEAFVASLSSCHMLFFLVLAAKRGYVVESYRDEAVGVMGKNDAGRMAMLTVTLRPEAVFGGDNAPTEHELHALHDAAHEECYIANSVKTEVRHEPVPVAAR